VFWIMEGSTQWPRTSKCVFNHLIGFYTILFVGVKQHLSNFLNLYYKMNGDVNHKWV
jgi:hypothetical protein